MQLLITGGEHGPRDVCDVGIVLILDLDSGEVLHRAEYRFPPELSGPELKVQLTGSCFAGNAWYVCTHNHIVVFEDWPPREPARTISLPGFNDLHHCMGWDGGLAVANTGLETVDLVSLTGELRERIDLLVDEPDRRTIDPDTDYRKVPDTKPHHRHGNHLFELDGDLWISQLRTEDAVCVRDPSRRMRMEVGQPHDGERIGDRIVFTTTNGHLVLFAPRAPYESEAFNLVEMTPGVNHLGWCRGVVGWPGARDRYIVGFSSLRRSKWKEFRYWITTQQSMTRGHLGLYNLKQGKHLRDWPLSQAAALQIFQVDLLPGEREI